MRTGKPSRTASQNALFRALEARRPAHARISDDRLAARLLPAEFRALAAAARLRPVRSALETVIDRRWPCARGGVVVRTRVIDDAISAELPGVEQVLLLGAGLDTRAYRLPGMDAVRVFEVDHPDTQAAKRSALSRVAAATAGRVRLVPVVFGRDDLREALRAAGFAEGRPTLVLWEGVTNYLDADTVDAAFRLLATLVGPGAPVIFTYVHAGILDGTATFAGATTTMAAVRRVGEPFGFGLRPAEVPDYLRARGFELASDVSVAEAGARLFPDSGIGLPDYYHVVRARRL